MRTFGPHGQVGMSNFLADTKRALHFHDGPNDVRPMEEATAEVTEQDLEGAWAEVTTDAGAMGWAMAEGVAAAEDKDAARDTDIDMGRQCVHGVPRLGTLSFTAGGNN
jgi:hypothetical protein